MSDTLGDQAQAVDATAETARALPPRFVVTKVTGKKKVPIDPGSGLPIDPHRPDAWLTEDEARRLSEPWGGTYGFVLTDDDPYVFLDFDNCRDPATGVWQPEAARLIGRFVEAGAASELSISETGAHVLCTADQAAMAGLRNRVDGWLELYHTKRFIQFGRHGWQGSVGIDCTGIILQEYPARDAVEWAGLPAEGPVPEYGGPANDAELVEMMLKARMSANAAFGVKAPLPDLWRGNADVLGRFYPDENPDRAYDYSRADAALATHLAFWTGRDVARIERLMRMSAVRPVDDRGKWDRASYIMPTIRDAAKIPGRVFERSDTGGTRLIRPGLRRDWQRVPYAEFTAGFVSPEYIIDGTVQRGRLYTLTAPTGSLKTAVMIYAGTAISTGMRFHIRETERAGVLFLAGENPDDVRARAVANAEHYGLDQAKLPFHFIPGTMSIEHDMDRLRDEAAQIPDLGLVVVDTLAAYFPGDEENSNAQMLQFARVVREITEFPGKPAVIMPAHPVKNAPRTNLLPRGGSAMLNEVDGNLTLFREDDGLVTLHWQGKIRGPDFQPLKFEVETVYSDRIRDKRGRQMPTVLANPVMPDREAEIASRTMAHEDVLLMNVEARPDRSVAARCEDIGLMLESGAPHKSGMNRLLETLSKRKLIRKVHRSWTLTPDGKKALAQIKNYLDEA